METSNSAHRKDEILPPDLSRQLRRFYSDSTAYRDHLAQKDESHFQNFVRLVSTHIPSDSSILEIGTGTGQVAWALSQKKYHVVGSDISFLFLRAASRTIATPAKPAFANCDAAALPFRSNSFDAVVGGELVEHLPDLNAVLREMARVVRPGGRIVLRSPALASPIWPLIDLPRLLTGKGGRPPHYNTFGEAMRFFGSNLMRSMRIALRKQVVFEQRQPDLDLSVEGGDRDAAYWSSVVEISRLLISLNFKIIQKVEISRPKLIGRLLAQFAPFLSPTIALVAEKK